jgi:hypothetical protein
VVVVSVEQFAKLGGARPDFKEFLREAPDLGRLKTPRDRKRARRVALRASCSTPTCWPSFASLGRILA